MQTNLYTYLRPVVLLLIALTCNDIAKAQQTIPDSATVGLSKRMGVSKEKAAQIQAAYSYHQDDIDRLMKDKSLNPQQKHSQLQFLLRQRKSRIDSVLTPQQKIKLRSLQSKADSSKVAAFKQASIRKHEQDMQRVPHKRTLIRSTADTAKTKVKPSKP